MASAKCGRCEVKQDIRNRFLRPGPAECVPLAVSALALMMTWTVSPSRPAEQTGHLRDAPREISDEPATLQSAPRHSNLLLVSCTAPTIKAQLGMPSPADKALREARTALAEGHLDDALQHCQEGLRMDPKSALAYFLLGMIQIRRGSESEARLALIQSLNLDPAHSATHYYLGRVYLKANELTAATNEFAAAIKLGDPSGAGHYGLALTLLAESHYAEAVPHLHTAVNRNLQDPERLFTLIGAELQLKLVDKARSDLVQVRERFPRDPTLAYRIGKTLLEYNLPDDAEAEFERASGLLAEAGPTAAPPTLNVSELSLQMARLRFDRHDNWGTLHVFDKIALNDIAPNLRPSAVHLEGQALVGIGKAPDALEKLRQAVQMNPTNPEYLVHLTWALLLAGDTKAAETTAQVAGIRWPNVPDVQLMQTMVKREGAAGRANVPLSQKWRVKGEGLVCCPCKVPCPCRSNAAPTHKHCENTALIHIHRGHYGKVSLDGVNFVAVNGAMETQTAPDMLYVEPSATDEQLIAVERIMQSFNPLQPSILLNVERTPITFVSRHDNVYEVKVPKLLEMRIRRELNPEGEPLFTTAALDHFSNTIEYARNLTYKFWDKNGALKWDYSGRQANFRTIDLDSRAYTDQTMLIQFADGSGGFNMKQLELIKSQNLPLLREYPRHASTGPEH
jgi:Flp pilus assembly protein TadD